MTITAFRGKYAFLSNFYSSPVYLDGELYPTVEHAYQAAKSLSAEDRQRIQLAATPAEAKRLGRKLNLREDWNDVRLKIMYNLLRQKFDLINNSELALLLESTAPVRLVEGNSWHDNYWGVCYCSQARCASVPKYNHLGRILMRIREENQQFR
jgi:hypothetical protein